ncbi:recombinase family protein [Rhodococcus ruber]|uniref:recombinase family protein n=1 Tax=Rhodococcus ruber TaxID=1830 RepID=UPI001F320F23|nr:recombinase family protein [Rhodococcus ruber]MCF8784683.1 recombinase family protein [Rhodococcus ruber]
MFTDTHPTAGPSKVTAAHLQRRALLYVRQSSLKQVLHNTESAIRQYDLRGKAIALGWAADQITVIDIDQGQSGASAADREGFGQLVADVSLGRAGIVLGLECSRLARNSADWHQLLELCAMTGTLICDEDGLYDPRTFNDRLLLGMKGQMSEAELHFIKARLRGGQLSKARRGELITPLPVGLVYDGAHHVILDPDTAVRGALAHLFSTFEATGSASACVKAFHTAGLLFPWRHLKGPRKGEIDWKPLAHSTALRVLHNPRYAGAFTYGRHSHHTMPGGKTVTTQLPREQWVSFIPGAHPRYITLDRYDANLARLQSNAAAHGRERRSGPPREGPALLQGIIVCGRCGLKMTVRYHHRRGTEVPTYMCQRDGIENGRPVCATIPGQDLDQAIGQLLIDTLTPLTVEAALQVSAELEHRAADADRLRAAHVERAHYLADLARRRYLAVDPANRLVADTLEADWNTALRALNQAQESYERARHEGTGHLTDAQKTRINQLVTDLPAIWNDPDTPQRERKRIARLLLTDVTITRTSDTITAHLRFPGGDHTTLTLPTPKPIGEQRKTSDEVVAAVGELLDDHTIGEIADLLRQRGLTTGTGEPFHRLSVDRVIRTYRLRSRRQRLRAAGMLTLAETAAAHGVTKDTVKAWRRAGIVGGQRYNDKGEYLYTPPDPDNPPDCPKIGRRTKGP